MTAASIFQTAHSVYEQIRGKHLVIIVCCVTNFDRVFPVAPPRYHPILVFTRQIYQIRQIDLIFSRTFHFCLSFSSHSTTPHIHLVIDQLPPLNSVFGSRRAPRQLHHTIWRAIVRFLEAVLVDAINIM